MVAASAVGMAGVAITGRSTTSRLRPVWKTPIGAHQGLSHRWLQKPYIEIEMAS